MDRRFRRAGLAPERLSPLDRLAYLGTRTMGALTFHPCTDEDAPAGHSVPLHILAAAAEQELSGHASELLPELLRAGGSPAGARPKVLVAVRGDDVLHGVDPPPLGYEPWLIKFSGAHERRDAGAVEYVYSRLARHAGLDLPSTRLFVAATGQRFFGVRRFDRDGAARMHVHTLAGLLDADFRLPSLDYDMLLRVTAHLTRSHAELQRAFRQMVFNVLAHNRDDHGKNFSFIMQRDGAWRLSPAYDLTLVDGPGGEHTMSIHGEARTPTWRHMLALARKASIDERAAVQILDEVRGALHRWPEEARATDIADEVIRDVAGRLAAVESAAELPGAPPPSTRRARRPAARPARGS